MKALTIGLALAPTVSSGLGAVYAVVEANNYGANNGMGAPIYYLNQGTLAPVGQSIFVQILGGPVGGPMEPLTDRPGNILTIPTGAGGAGPGFFDAGAAFVPGVAAGSEAQFQVRAWQGISGFANARYAVASPVWMQATGSWNDSILGEVTGPSLQIPVPALLITSVPEPSTLALALLGGVVWPLQRRWRRVPNKQLEVHEEYPGS